MQLNNLKKFLKKRYIISAIIVIFIVFFSIKNHNGNNMLTDTVKVLDLQKSVLATGQVVSKTELELSFNTSGLVSKIDVEIGDKVRKGQVLASLRQASLLASLTQARGILAGAQAKYQNTIEGSSDEEVALAKILLENAKKEYEKVKAEQDAIVEKEDNDFWRTGENIYIVGAQDKYIIAKQQREKLLIQAQSVIDQRQAELDIKVANATDSEIALAKADILSAQGQVEKAQADLENSIIRAPQNGTITKIDIKLGELAEVNKKAITIEDVENLYIEAKINEANIALVKIGDPVQIVYDSLGPEKVFNGVVFSIDPSSTTEDGVVNYKIKIALDEIDAGIKPGMNADLTIITFKKEQVLVVPKLAVTTKNGINYLKVLHESKRKIYNEVPVVLGEEGDGNLVEIIEGAVVDQKIVVSTK